MDQQENIDLRRFGNCCSECYRQNPIAEMKLRRQIAENPTGAQRGAAVLSATPCKIYFLRSRYLILVANHFGLELRAILVSDLAVMQVAINPDEPTFGAFQDDFLGQFPESDYGMPLDVFFSPNLFLVAMRNEAALSLAPKKAASAPRLPVRITRLLLKDFRCWLFALLLDELRVELGPWS